MKASIQLTQLKQMLLICSALTGVYWFHCSAYCPTVVRHELNRCVMVRVDNPAEKWKSLALTLHNASVWVGYFVIYHHSTS